MASHELLAEVHGLVPNERKGKVRNFGEMMGILPNSLVESEINRLQDYFLVQVAFADGSRNKAREMMRGLAKRTGWDEFEDTHKKLLAVIDVAVRGETRQFTEIASSLSEGRVVKKV